jgi:chorismate synthase
MGNSFGHLFRITTWGESHGGGVGVVIDGCPPRIPFTEADIQRELDRRRPGQSSIVTQRNEADRAEILSGVFDGQTLGTPIAILVRNEDADPEAYKKIVNIFRPSHADYTYEAKYGIRNWQAADARQRARPSAASQLAQWRSWFSRDCSLRSSSSPTSRKFTRSSRRSIRIGSRAQMSNAMPCAAPTRPPRRS